MDSIPNYSKYIISRFGLIVNKERNKEVKQHQTKKGYLRVRLYNEFGGKSLLVHRLVALTYLHNIQKLPVVNHKDGNKQNNDCDNLEWCSVGYNQLHAYRTGLRRQHQGEKHGRAKLTDGDVILIRQIYSSGGVTYTDLAKSWGVGKSMIGYIVTNKNWNHL